MNQLAAVVFGGLSLVALSRLLSAAASARTLGQVVVLLLIALLGYRYGKADRFLRIAGIIAFVVAWFWMPIVPLLALCGTCIWASKRKPIAQPAAKSEPTQPALKQKLLPLDMVNATMALQLAGGEFDGKVRNMAVAFGSIYGEHSIPLLVELEGREHAVYVETGAWDNAAKTRWYKWVAALRTSEREELPVLIRSPTDIPDDVSTYAENSPRNAFELTGMMNVKWTDTPHFTELNAATLRRLAHEYFGIDLGQGLDALERVDQFVIERLGPSGRVLPSTLLLIGSFFGEALIAELGGEWKVRGRSASDVMVEIAKNGKTVEGNVFGKAAKLLRNAREDSLAAMAKSMLDQLR